ncbi:MAG: hypothetical protein K8S98_06825 [Planctomycetes bacterium]|nr:hypothetical protein [Planctomycetota bacterium]
MRFSSLKPWLGAAALVAVASLAWAQIERLTLADLATRAVSAVDGTIIERKVFRVDHPVDGPELYFTTLTIQGQSVETGTALTVDVTFPGGFVSPTEGVSNSEAPSADDIRIGNHIVAFYKWTGNMGGGVAANQLYASHGGLYRVIDTKSGTVVQGRGDGYAVSTNLTTSKLRADFVALRGKK